MYKNESRVSLADTVHVMHQESVENKHTNVFKQQECVSHYIQSETECSVHRSSVETEHES